MSFFTIRLKSVLLFLVNKYIVVDTTPNSPNKIRSRKNLLWSSRRGFLWHPRSHNPKPTGTWFRIAVSICYFLSQFPTTNCCRAGQTCTWWFRALSQLNCYRGHSCQHFFSRRRIPSALLSETWHRTPLTTMSHHSYKSVLKRQWARWRFKVGINHYLKTWRQDSDPKHLSVSLQPSKTGHSRRSKQSSKGV